MARVLDTTLRALLAFLHLPLRLSDRSLWGAAGLYALWIIPALLIAFVPLVIVLSAIVITAPSPSDQ